MKYLLSICILLAGVLQLSPDETQVQHPLRFWEDYSSYAELSTVNPASSGTLDKAIHLQEAVEIEEEEEEDERSSGLQLDSPFLQDGRLLSEANLFLHKYFIEQSAVCDQHSGTPCTEILAQLCTYRL